MRFPLPGQDVNQLAPPAAKSGALLQNGSGAFASGANPKPTRLTSQARLRLERLHIFFSPPSSSHSRARNLMLFSHCVVGVESEDGGHMLSPPGVRWAAWPLGCRLSFVLLGALRSFSAAGLR